METTGLIIGGAILSGIIIAVSTVLYAKKKKRDAFNYENEVIPYAMGDSTIYLRRHEIPHFEALGRSEKRKIVSRFNASLKRGDIIPVRKHGKIIGFTRK